MPSRLRPSLVPSQEHCRDKIPWHLRVWAAVIRRAAADWIIYKTGHGESGARLAEEARHWLFDEDTSDLFNSFVAVCGYLGLEPEVVRARVLDLTEDDVKKRRAMEFGDE